MGIGNPRGTAALRDFGLMGNLWRVCCCWVVDRVFFSNPISKRQRDGFADDGSDGRWMGEEEKDDGRFDGWMDGK